MAELGAGSLGTGQLGSNFWGESVEGGQSISWDLETVLASGDTWPLLIEMQIVLEFIDPEHVAGIHFSIDDECDASVDWTVKDVDNQTGEITIDVGVTVECPEDKESWGGGLRGDFEYDGSNGINNSDSSGEATKPDDGDGDGDGDEQDDVNSDVKIGTPKQEDNPGSDPPTNPSVISLGGSCTPGEHQATIPVTFDELLTVKEYEIVLEWDPTKLSYAGYVGTPPDYTEDNASTAFYFADAQVDASEGRLTMSAVDDDTINPIRSSNSKDAPDSGYLGSLQFDVVGGQGEVAELTFDQSATAYYDTDGRELGPENYEPGQITIENGLNIGQDEAYPNQPMSAPVSVQAGMDVADYTLEFEYPAEFFEFDGVTAVTGSVLETSSRTVERNISSDDFSPIYREFGYITVTGTIDGGARDPALFDLEFTALLPHDDTPTGGSVKLTSKSLSAPDGSEITLGCNSSGSLTVRNFPETDGEEIPREAIVSYPLPITRTFLVEDLKVDLLKDIKVKVESSTNPTSVQRNWVQIPYALNKNVAAVNATIFLEEPEGTQESPADLTTSLQFFWTNSSTTTTGLYAGQGIHFGGVKGLFSGARLLSVGNTRGDFGNGLQF